MLQVAGDQIVGASGIGAFQKDVIVGIAGYFETPSGSHIDAAVLDELHELLSQALPNAEFWTRKTSLYSSKIERET